MADAPDHVRDDEILYRRLLSSKYDPLSDHSIPQDAFRPSRHDQNGISWYRAKDLTPEQVASAGRNLQGYHVLAVRAGDLRARGLTLVADDDPKGHVSIPEMNYNNRRSDETIEHAQVIADCLTTVVLHHLPNT